MSERRKVGVWLIGARGSLATCVVYGSAALRRGLAGPIGLVTARGPCTALDLADPGEFVFGGHEVRRGSIEDTAAGLVREAIVPPAVADACREDARAAESLVRPGFSDAPPAALGPLEPGSTSRSAESGAAIVERLRADLRDFRRRAGVDRLVVVHVASTEPICPRVERWANARAFARDLAARDRRRRPPPSVLYAAAAIEERAPFVNFTPSPGAAVGALLARAIRRGVPHCGNDGKTGETLVKTALAPMFVHRNLRVMSWEGYNLLGNRDGAVLDIPARREAKTRTKDEAVRRILGDPAVHTRVSIDFVPSLADWKTAWDFVHFRGFFGVPMTLQFVWQGCDKALAAPLVLDLVRLADFAQRRGESGAMAQTACFFKTPIGVDEHALHVQAERLDAYAREAVRRRRRARPGPGRGAGRSGA